jgi:hypothetical protein
MEDTMNKIQRTSKFLRWSFTLFFFALPLLFICENFLQGSIFFALPTSHGAVNLTLNHQDHWIMVLLNFVRLLLQLFIIFCFIKLFSAYQIGKVFAKESINYIRKVGYSLLAIILLQPITQMVMSFVLTRHNTALRHQIFFSITPAQIALLFTGIMVLLVSWIMHEASHIKDENDSFL